MKTLPSILLLFLILALTGCGNPTADLFLTQQNRAAKASGSPFRWRGEKMAGGAVQMTRVMIDLPRGDTKADAVLRRDILSQIRKVELSKGRGTPEVAEVRLLPDGREVWVLASKSQGIAYVVTLKHAPQGGTNYTISGPETFQRA